MTSAWRFRAPAWFGGARRLLLILGLDALLITLSIYAAYLLRFEGAIWPEYRADLLALPARSFSRSASRCTSRWGSTAGRSGSPACTRPCAS